jgi:hypothetical protein
VVGLTLLAHSAQATPFLPGLTNLNFLTYTGVAPKAQFSSVNPTGWIGGDNLIFIDTPGTASNPNSACGSVYLSTYGCPSTLAIAGGYNYVEADGNPAFETGFGTVITGLTPGQDYELSFYQAASQQRDFIGDTTEQWIVGLGTAIMQSVGNGGGVCDLSTPICTYSNADPLASIVATPLMNTPSGGMTDWNFVTVMLTAHAPTEFLSFLAWGDNGNTTNLPPILFLTGVDAPSDLTPVPEPATLTLLGMGIAGLAARRRRRAKQV